MVPPSMSLDIMSSAVNVSASIDELKCILNLTEVVTPTRQSGSGTVGLQGWLARVIVGTIDCEDWAWAVLVTDTSTAEKETKSKKRTVHF